MRACKKSATILKIEAATLICFLGHIHFAWGACDYQKQVENLEKASLDVALQEVNSVEQAEDLYSTFGLDKNPVVKQAKQNVNKAEKSIENYRQVARIVEDAQSFLVLKGEKGADNQEIKDEDLASVVPHLVAFAIEDINGPLHSSGVAPLSLAQIAQIIVKGVEDQTYCPEGAPLYSASDISKSIIGPRLPKVVEEPVCALDPLDAPKGHETAVRLGKGVDKAVGFADDDQHDKRKKKKGFFSFGKNKKKDGKGYTKL